MTSPDGGAARPIELRQLPLVLFQAASQQWGDLLRDYLLRGIGGSAQPYSADSIARSVSALDLLRQAVAEGALQEPHAERIDVVLALGSVTAGDFAVLQGALDHGRQLAIAGEMLAPPTLPEVVALRNWFCDQVVDQTSDAEPDAWQFIDRIDAPVEVELAEWDSALSPPDDEAWLVADDHNRIVVASSAASTLLGWSGSLVGHRLLAVIPERLREQHVAGFTRSVLGGDDRLLGVPLALPALRRDGTEVAVTLTLSKHRARRGRAVYLGRLAPDESAAAISAQ
ncbi:MAG TPA: PAS domain-containing protein [Mycobacteriales bacterium]|nr:PAS domain-containing protein [Mycobacteriales bacterium]